MPDATPEPSAGRSFEDMLADPGEQFDPRSELLASIAAYAAAPSDTPSAAPPAATPPRPLTAPGVVAGLLADVADARAQLADVRHGAGAWIREAVARETAGLTAQLAEVTAELAGARRKLVAEGSRARAEAATREQSARLARTSDGPLEALAAAWERQASDQEKKIDSGEVTRTSKRVSQARLLRALALQLREAIACAELAASRERDDVRSAFAKLAGHFTQGAQSGWTARISGTVLRRLCVMAGCEPPSGSDAPDEASELRAIIAEIIDWFWDPDPEMPGDAADARVDEWRQRAGLDAP